MTNMNTPDASLGQLIGREAGTAMAGNAPITVSTAQLESLGNQIPSGARIDPCRQSVTFSTTTVSLVIEGAPSDNPDMTFRIAGLVNPIVSVPRSTEVNIEFVNADNDEAHAFVITTAPPPYELRPRATAAFAGSATGPIGDPTPAGHGVRNLAFVASTPGTYRYLCPMPGHAEMGMTGLFIVT
jgi:rusticyanin